MSLMEPSNNLASLVAQFIAEHNHFIGTDRISSAESLIQQAVQCFVEYLNSSFPRSSRARASLTTMLENQEVADALKLWRGGINQNIMHLAFSCRDSILTRTLIQKIGTDLIFQSDKLGKFPVENAENLLPLKDMEEFQTVVKNILLIKRHPILQPKILLPHLRFTDEDKLKCAKVLHELSAYDLNNDEILCNTWYQLAQLFPSSDDIEKATKLIVLLLQQPRRYTREGLLHNMLKSYPNINADHFLNSVKKWPRYNSEFVAAFIRDANAPYWLMQGILGTSLKDCNYSWIQKQLATKNKLTFDELLSNEEDRASFHLFEDLPEDIIYYMMSHMHFRHIIALSITSKRLMKLVNESQHVWTMFGHKYFTKLSVSSAKDFGKKYRSKFKTGKLLHQFRPIPSNYINSIELNGDSALLVQSSGVISLLRTHCLDRPKNQRKKLTTIQLRKGWARSARLFNDWIFTVTLPVSFEPKHDEHITIINTKNTKLQHHIKSPFLITNDTNPYFTVDEKTLLAKGFSLDVASGTITEVPWTVDLSKWIIRDDIVYGTEIVRHFTETNSSTAWLKLFDQRTPGKLAAALQLQNLRCFNVSDHNIYAVTSHVMQWDKRYLSRPVRKSTDLYFYSKDNPIGNPAIDLTSMTVIGADQIWDLTDFTWRLPSPYRVPPRITTNDVMDELVADFVAALKVYNASELDQFNSSGTILEQAIQCVVRWRYQPYHFSLNHRSIIAMLMQYNEVVEGLKKKHEEETDIFELRTDDDAFMSYLSTFYLRTIVKPVSEDRYKTLAKKLIFFEFIPNKSFRPKDAGALLPDLEFNEEDKIKCEEIWRRIRVKDNRSQYAIETDRVIYQIWLQTAQKYPSSNDVDIATQMIIEELQLGDMSPLLLDLIKSYPNVDVERILSEVKKWPGPYAKDTVLKLRQELPYWVLQGVLGTTVQDCNYSWIQRQLMTQKNQGLREHVHTSFDLFEELPEDVIYYMMSHMSFRTVVVLSQTSKRMMKLVNESQHVWTMFGHRYFTNIPITSASDLNTRYKLKFETGTLLHQFPAYIVSEQLSSIELIDDKIVTVDMSGKISIIETLCLKYATGKHGKKGKKSKNPPRITKIGFKTSARLFNDHIYALSIKNQVPSVITIIEFENKNRKTHTMKEIQCPALSSDQLYFTIDQNSLLANGFAMDLTTQQITEQHWTKDLSKWIIRDDIIYGWENTTYLVNDRNYYRTDSVKLFDTRTPQKLVGELRCEKLQCFNVRDNGTYTVSSHVMQWDKRYLSRPVRTSTDPYFSCHTKNKWAGHPVIDLTSMTVISADQIWDLTDFTWQLTSLPREKNTIITNGILVAYSVDGATNVRQVACTKGITGPISTHAELQILK